MVDPTVSRVYGDVTVNGKVAATSAYLLKLDGRTLQPLKTEGDTAILQGTKVEISDVAAPVLNKVFKTNAVKPGLLVGIAKITVNTKKSPASSYQQVQQGHVAHCAACPSLCQLVEDLKELTRVFRDALARTSTIPTVVSGSRRAVSYPLIASQTRSVAGMT